MCTICTRHIRERTGFYFILIGLIATQCNTEAAVNGSPRFCVSKANILLNSPRSNLALHSVVPLSHSPLLSCTHTLTVPHSQEEKERRISIQ